MEAAASDGGRRSAILDRGLGSRGSRSTVRASCSPGISASRRGSPFDNATAKSFIKTLGIEAIHVAGDETLEDAGADLPSLVGEVRNPRRLHLAP